MTFDPDAIRRILTAGADLGRDERRDEDNEGDERRPAGPPEQAQPGGGGERDRDGAANGSAPGHHGSALATFAGSDSAPSRRPRSKSSDQRTTIAGASTWRTINVVPRRQTRRRVPENST
jgi:hypothetical protein